MVDGRTVVVGAVANPGVDVSSGSRTSHSPNGQSVTSQSLCCKACDADTECETWVFAPTLRAPATNCWLLKGVTSTRSAPDRVVGGAVPTTRLSVSLTLGRSASSLFFGSGAGVSDATVLTRISGAAYVRNTDFETPSHYCSDGYSALAVSLFNSTTDQLNVYPVTWSAAADGFVQWRVEGPRADLYLSPAPTLQQGLTAYFNLTGRPPVPPRWAFGFLACRWGWTDANYIADVLSQFRNESYPVDAFIMDYEWFT